MPPYEYECPSCGKTEERLLGVIENPEVICRDCSTEMQRVLARTANHRGVYQRPRGKTCCGADERCDKPPCEYGEGQRRP